MDYSFSLTRAPTNGSQSPEEVEKQLRHVSKKLAETEVNIGLFNKMARGCVPTNDVRHFILNQTRMKQSGSKIQYSMVRKIMKEKLNDACSVANKLRQKKRALKRLLCTKFSYPKSRHNRVLREVSVNTANHKDKHRDKTAKKFVHCKSKMNNVINERSIADIPKDTWDIAKGVNIFNKELFQEECADPMICAKDIELSQDELEFLRKGPRFMMRQHVKEDEFMVDIEKMIVKEKYDANSSGREESGRETGAFNRSSREMGVSDSETGVFNRSSVDTLSVSDRGTGVFNRHSTSSYPFEVQSKDGCGTEVVNKPKAESNSDLDRDLEALSNEILAKAGMIYSKESKSLNLGKLKATDYKFNKFLHLPRPESTYREAVHEIRKTEMMKVFKKTLKSTHKSSDSNRVKANCSSNGQRQSMDIKNQCGSSNESVKSNLSPAEQRGLKSLQSRVKKGEIVVTETDKSRRFCVLKKSQYTEAGQKHTSKDMKISYSHLHSVQKLVNDHSKWLKKIFNIGCEWGHEERIAASMTDKGEVVSPLYLLIKDHKQWRPEDGTPSPSRPICSGKAGFNRHISEIL